MQTVKFKMLLTIALLALTTGVMGQSTWRDIKLDLASCPFLGESPVNGTAYKLGIAIAEDGTQSRVEADDASANIVLDGTYHNDHGWSTVTATVKVEGSVKVGIGQCTFGGKAATITDAAGNKVEVNVGITGCHSRTKSDAQVSYGYYNGEATTLTIKTNTYTPYLSIEKTEEVIAEATVTYSIGNVVCEGVAVPAATTVVVGEKVTVPANFTLYAEGKTLTGWTDGTKTYAAGVEIAPTADVTLTPVFTTNEVSLEDRTEAVTLKWDFQRKNGAPSVAWQNQEGLIWVTQTVVKGKTIDVKCDFSTNPGKFANGNWTDWCQLNGGTKFTIPSCKGAVVSIEGYNALGVASEEGQTSFLTIDGKSDYESAKTVSYEIANEAETIEVVMGEECSYYRYIQTVLPVVPSGKSYTNEETTVVWAFTDSSNPALYTVTPSGVLSQVNADLGDLEITGTGTGQAVDEDGNKIAFLKLKPSGTTTAVKWEIQPAAGLTFTPTKVSMYIQRFATDAENGVTVSALLADGTNVILGNYTAPRYNRTQAEDQYGSNSNYTNKVEIELTAEQQAQLASTDGFTLSATVGVGSEKEGGFSDVQIHGLINGTALDGTAPAVVGSVPDTGVKNASANGRVVINFDEKIKLTDAAKATLNGEELALTVSGKTVTAEYERLSYATDYTFQLAAGSVSDFTDNVLDEDVTIGFTTMNKSVVTKALYDFIVPDDGNFKEALEAAAARDDMNQRYRIFVKQGAHIIPADESVQIKGADSIYYADPRTYFNTPNVSIIGEDMNETSIANYMSDESFAGQYGPTHPLEGIRNSGLLYLQSGATNTYFEDITLKTNTPDATGRNVILVDGGNKTICKDVCLWAYQDTYVSDRTSSLYYFEGGVIRGRTDFICGKGDVFFNGVDIIMCEKGGFIVAPRDNVKYGYVFKGCTIKGGTNEVNGNYFLGRPWTEAAETYYIDCVMEAIPTAAGWTNMSKGGCTRFAEYNSVKASGALVDLSGRVTELGTETVNPNSPVLSAEEAAEIGNMTNMFGDWDPTLATEQASAPTNVKIYEKVMTWDNNDYVLLWAICKDGKVIDFTTEPTYTVDDATATYSVRAANEMGGLGEATEAVAANVLVINDTETECDDFNPTSESYDRVVYNRELDTGYTYGLICLPFAPDAESLTNFQFYTLSSVDGDAVTFVEEETPVANTPYLYSIKEGATRTSTITGGETTVSTEVKNTTVGTWTLVGSLKNETIDCTADATINNYVFNPTKNTLHKVTKALTVYPYTAYVRNNVASTQNSLSQMRVFIGTPTGIKEISRDQIEGFGDKAGMFDLQGRALSNPVKGQIYIENGEKKIKN